MMQRRTLLHRRSTNLLPRPHGLNVYQPDLHTDIPASIAKERQAMKTLDRHSAKKIISQAEHSLLKFLRSKAQVNCLRREEEAKPIYAASQAYSRRTPALFNEDQLHSRI